MADPSCEFLHPRKHTAAMLSRQIAIRVNPDFCEMPRGTALTLDGIIIHPHTTYLGSGVDGQGLSEGIGGVGHFVGKAALLGLGWGGVFAEHGDLSCCTVETRPAVAQADMSRC